MKPVRIGLLGPGFIADLHAAAIRMIPAEMEVAAVRKLAEAGFAFEHAGGGGEAGEAR